MKKWRYGDPLAGRTQIGKPLEFLQSAALAGDGPCIEWPFAIDQAGYGRVTWDGKRRPAHLVSLVLKGEPKPFQNAIALHEPIVCHNRACVRGSHIRWGTHKENMQDRSLDETEGCGANNGRAKLTESDVLSIRRSTENGTDLAAMYGVTTTTIHHIRTRKTWKNLP